MKFLKLARKNKDISPESWERLYKTEIQRRIRKRYSPDDEFAILRQKEDKPEEFADYNAYVEQCKAEVKNTLQMGE